MFRMVSVARSAAITLLVLLSGTIYARGGFYTPSAPVRSLPPAPLGISVTALPMTMIVAGKNHKLFFEAYPDYLDMNNDGVFEINFDNNFKYIGLFEYDVCYSYDSGNNLFEAASMSPSGECSGSWSGNWLNYMTSSRMDILRKILYGGKREVDTATETILRRAYIPRDGHSWAKTYESAAVNGYDLTKFTPLSMPAAGSRHHFGNYTDSVGRNCRTIDTCSNLPPLLTVVTNSSRLVWDWASTQAPVLRAANAGGPETDYQVRIKACVAVGLTVPGCRLYKDKVAGTDTYKPVGLLHDYGQTDRMLFGLITGSYDTPLEGGRLRKVISKFSEEINPKTGQFTANADIIKNLDAFRISGFNGTGPTDHRYGPGDFDNPISTASNVQYDWGNPIAEMVYEAVRYFAGEGSPTGAFVSGTSEDRDLGLSNGVSWDNPYAATSAAGLAKSNYCSIPNILVLSDIDPSYDSDNVPGSGFGGMSAENINGSSLNVSSLANTIGSNEGIHGSSRFVGEAGGTYDGMPTRKTISSLGNVRGLASEPTKEGSYYSAAVSYFARINDINSATDDQRINSYYISLASPQPKFEFEVAGQPVSIVPLAKTIGYGSGVYEPTNQITDYYIDEIVNMGTGYDPAGPLPRAKFRVNFEDAEYGFDYDMDVIMEYDIQVNASNQIVVSANNIRAAGAAVKHLGYVIDGTSVAAGSPEAGNVNYPGSGPHLVVRDNNRTALELFPVGDVPRDTDGSLPLSSTLTFEPSGSAAATTLKDPFWYAAKWGGFRDFNGNNIPDDASEWDRNADGTPDNYFLAQNPGELKEAINRSLSSILTVETSSSNVEVNSEELDANTRVFQASYAAPDWTGDLKAYSISTTGTPVLEWSAEAQLPAHGARNIYTAIPGRGGLRVRKFENAATLDAMVNPFRLTQAELDYIRGDQSQEMSNGGIFRNRSSILGDMIHSHPVYDKETNTVYVGGNDGMLHAFNATTGIELFAYVPFRSINKLRELTKPEYSDDPNDHLYFVDGGITITTRAQTPGKSILIASFGRGGRGLFALDVTNPGSFGASDVLWETGLNDEYAGHILHPVTIAKLEGETNYEIISGNGYGSPYGEPILLRMNIMTGGYSSINNEEFLGYSPLSEDSGLTSVVGIDTDENGAFDHVYGGDLKGRVWRFDFNTSGGTSRDRGRLLFTATDAAGEPQPITAPMSAVIHNDPNEPYNFGFPFLHFGTGSYYRIEDVADSQVQTWYGFADRQPPPPVGGRYRTFNVYDRKTHAGAELMERTIEKQEALGGKVVRVFEKAAFGDMNGKVGWFMDMKAPGATTSGPAERITTQSTYLRLARRALTVSSFTPSNDSCSPAGGSGFINIVSPFTGGRIASEGLIDLDGDDDFSNDRLSGADEFAGGVEHASGAPSQPVLVGDKVVFGDTDPKVNVLNVNTPVIIKGRLHWRELE